MYVKGNFAFFITEGSERNKARLIKRNLTTGAETRSERLFDQNMRVLYASDTNVYIRLSSVNISVYKVSDLTFVENKSFPKSFDRLFVGTNGHFYLAQGKFVYHYDAQIKNFKQYQFDHPVKGFDGDNFYYWNRASLFKIAVAGLKEFTFPDDPETQQALARRNLDKEEKLKTVSLKKAYAQMGFRFFTAFPYEKVGTQHEGYRPQASFYESGSYVKCRFYTIGAKIEPKIREGFGGDSYSNGLPDITDNFVVSDWLEGFPVRGGRISGKDFFITSAQKLSYSSIRDNQWYGNPIKTLFATGNFNFKIKSVKYTDILKRDFMFLSDPLNDFFDAIDDGEDSFTLNLGDPFTYVFRDIDGSRPKISAIFQSDIGAFSSAGAQAIAFTDKGVFYWGVNARAQNASNFVNMGKVSKFLGAGNFSAIAEVLDKLYVQDDRGNFYVVVYDQANRNFTAFRASGNITFKGSNSIHNFIGDRLLAISDGKLFCLNTDRRGPLSGETEFTLEGRTFERVEKIGDKFFFITKDEDGKFYFHEYEERLANLGDDLNGNIIHYKGIIETAPLTLGQNQPMHTLDAQRILTALTIFSKNLKSLEYKGRVGDDQWVSLNRYKLNDLSVFPDVLNVKMPLGIDNSGSLSLRMDSRYGGCLCGLSMVCSVAEQV